MIVRLRAAEICGATAVRRSSSVCEYAAVQAPTGESSKELPAIVQFNAESGVIGVSHGSDFL